MRFGASVAVGCSAHGPIDQFLLLFPKDNSSKSVHQWVTHLAKVSEGPRRSQKDPLKNSNLEHILNGCQRWVPLQIAEFDEIQDWKNLAPKIVSPKLVFLCPERDCDETSVFQRDPSLPVIWNVSKFRVFKWVLLEWPESLWNLV